MKHRVLSLDRKASIEFTKKVETGRCLSLFDTRCTTKEDNAVKSIVSFKEEQSYRPMFELCMASSKTSKAQCNKDFEI